MGAADHEPPARRLPSSVLIAEVYRAPVDKVGTATLKTELSRDYDRAEGRSCRDDQRDGGIYPR